MVFIQFLDTAFILYSLNLSHSSISRVTRHQDDQVWSSQSLRAGRAGEQGEQGQGCLHHGPRPRNQSQEHSQIYKSPFNDQYQFQVVALLELI